MKSGQFPIIIDCDTGRDDALTLWTAAMRGIPVAAVIASYGNVPRGAVADNTARVMTLGGMGGIPLFLGADRPSRDHAAYRNAVVPRQEKSGNGLCGLTLPPAAIQPAGPMTPERLAALAEQHGKLHYLILGPATGLAALARAMGDSIHDHIARVTMMGGKTGPLWEAMPGADFNILCDPFAVQFLIDLRLYPRFVTLNTTWDIALSLTELENLRPQGDLARMAQNLMLAHVRHFSPDPLFRFHDPSALLAAAGEDAGFKPARLQIACADQAPDFGRIVCANGPANAAFYEADERGRQDFRETILAALGLESGSAC